MEWVSTSCLPATELAAFLGTSRRQVDELRKTGIIPAYRIGRSWRFNLAAVVEALERQAAVEKGREASPALSSSHEGGDGE